MASAPEVLSIATLPGVKTHAVPRPDRYLHLPADQYLGLHRGREQWPHQLWLQNTMPLQKPQKKLYGFRNFINDLRVPGVHIDTVPLYIDNNSALKLTRNPEFHNRSKHIDVKHHFVRESVEEEVINTQHVNRKNNLADIFTKSLPKPRHEDVVHRLNLSSGEGTKKPDCVTAEITKATEKNG